MRSSILTDQKRNILDADVKTSNIWLFQIDTNNDGTPEYYWSTQGYTYDGHDYTFKIADFSDIKHTIGNPELDNLPSSKMTINIANKDNVYTAASFIGASIKVLWIAKANLGVSNMLGDIVDVDVTDENNEAEEEMMSFCFKVKAAKNVYQEITLECVDWFSEYLEGDYPNTPMLGNLFPSDIMPDDNYCLPIIFGTCYFPLRWAIKWQDVIYVDADTFTIAGDYTSLFAAGYWLWANCGVDGLKDCWVLSSSYATGTTTVNLTAGSDDLTSNLTQVYIDFYVLGSNTPTYTINRCKAPKECPGDEYLASSYTFKQDSILGSDGTNYKIVRAIINDYDKDGSYDSNGYWRSGDQVFDTPFKLSRSDLASKTNPPDIVEYIFETWGMPSNKIDDTSKDAAAAIFTARGFSLNIPLRYPQPRKKLLCKILAISGLRLIIRDKVYFKVLTKTSQLTIETELVSKLTFDVNISTIYTEKKKDSGYVVWQKSTDPVGQGYENKQLVATKSTTDNPSDTTIECEWISDDDGIKQKKAGKLALQRVLLRDKGISFIAKNKFALLEPGDMITVNPANYDTDGTPYDIQIETMTFPKDFSGIGVELIRFRDALEDWDDLSGTAIVVGAVNDDRGYSPVYQGPSDPNGTNKPNEITQNVYIGANGVLSTNVDPATNGGFIATNEQLTCYSTSGVRFQVKYAGDDQGDVKWGDYDNGKGFFYDQSAGKSYFKTDAAGGVEISGGGDITLAGSDTDPGVIKFHGTSYDVELGGDADGDRFSITPLTNNAVDLILGDQGDYWFSDRLFKNIYLRSDDTIRLIAGPVNPNYSRSELRLNADNEKAIIAIQHASIGLARTYHTFTYSEGLWLGNGALNGTLKLWPWQDDSLADDGTINLPDATSGLVMVSCNGEAGIWLIQSNGTVTGLTGSANTASTDIDTKLCVYNGGGTQAIVKNRLGTAGEIRIFYLNN